MDEGSGFSPVIRYSFEMPPYQYQPLISRGQRETDHFGPARLAEALVQGRPNKTMSVYYDEFDIPDHDCIFLNIASVLPAVLQARNLLWSKVGDSS